MIETALVHIHSFENPKTFVGCGAIIEGGYIATCRHVWRKAGGEKSENRAVWVVFPRSFGEDGEIIRCIAPLAEECKPDGNEPEPDLVLLHIETPAGLKHLQLAWGPEYEHGEAYAWATLPSKDIDVKIDGRIDNIINRKGRREFSDKGDGRYWLEKGSSGSPVFLKPIAQHLAGLISQAEIDDENPQPTDRLREAFVVPASIIAQFVARAKANPYSVPEKIDPALFNGILAQLGHENVPVWEIPAKIEAAFADLKVRAERAAFVLNDSGNIAATAQAAGGKLGKQA